MLAPILLIWKTNEEEFMKILIVEDDLQVTNYVMKRLAKWGYNSKSAKTGKEALQIFSDENFDLILLDIMLSDYKGYDLIPKFKNINQKISIITMTGHNSREFELKVREQGILYYMVKPIETKNLKLLLDHIKNNN
jgi:DNA-binding response OmpR family regulator